LASKYDPPFAPKNVPPRPPQVFEVKHLFSAGMVQSRIQISGPVGSNFGANQHGKPNQNAYIESFNGRLRDECLNEHWFLNLAHAQALIEAWRREYNEERPKKALGGLTP
jgi:hypothetical protein